MSMHSVTPLLFVQAGIIIALSRTVGLAARRLGQPLVVAEVIAGIMLGPSLLGRVAPGVVAVVFPPESLSLLNALSQLGLILFMFIVGLELDPRHARGRGRPAVLISHASIVVPSALGVLLGFYLYPRTSSPTVPFTSFVLFVAIAMSITAFPVLARILTDRGLARTRLGIISITCAAVDDVTAWCLLAFVVAIVRSSGIAGAFQTGALALLYIGMMLVLVRPFLKGLGRGITAAGGVPQDRIALVMLLLLASSWTTEQIGIHSLFGAFLLGGIMPKDGPLASLLVGKLKDFAVVFLLPLFFAYSGLRTQIGLLDSTGAWLMCGLITAAACLGKFGGSTVAARITGLSWRESSAIGILMNTRGLMELVVLNIGLDLGVLSPSLFAMMTIMAIVTTMMTTPILARVYPLGVFGPEGDDASATVEDEQPISERGTPSPASP